VRSGSKSLPSKTRQARHCTPTHKRARLLKSGGSAGLVLCATQKLGSALRGELVDNSRPTPHELESHDSHEVQKRRAHPRAPTAVTPTGHASTIAQLPAASKQLRARARKNALRSPMLGFVESRHVAFPHAMHRAAVSRASCSGPSLGRAPRAPECY